MGFKKDFLWGAATASYQIEGAYQTAGKGLNIWDSLCREKGRVNHNETGDMACDHYHHFKEDITLMKEIGINAYRFSISWTRILPEGKGNVNPEGIAFYSDLVDELIKNDIEPIITLFHWDYPMELFKKGGWLNDDSPLWFEEYVKVVIDALSDRVTYWITLNEPQIFTNHGHRLGVHAPFVNYPNEELLHIIHNVLLSHGRAVKTIRKYGAKKPLIGFAPTALPYIPKNSTENAIKEAREKTFGLYINDSFCWGNSMWMDPVFLGDYPKEAYETFGHEMPVMTPEDKEIITSPLDFLGLNTYESTVTNKESDPYQGNSYVGSPRTGMDWSVIPEALYWSPKFMSERYDIPVMITENGLANNDWVNLDGNVHDPQRIDFTHRYLKELKRAADDGIDIIGYMHWSLLDNFEWNYGYDKRFGLIHVDYLTQKRTIKDSAYWYKGVICENGECL